METVNIRKMNCELGILSRPDGSALFTTGDTVVLAAVYGPVEVKLQKLMIDKASVEVTFKPKIGQTSVLDKLKESTLLNVCQSAILSTQYPRTAISVIIQEMQDCGGLLATSINGACLALMNGGIPMKYLFAAVNCMIDKNNEIILNPNNRQLMENKASFTFVFESTEKKIIATETSGSFTKEQFSEILNVCKEASSHIFQFYRDIVKKYSWNLSPT